MKGVSDIDRPDLICNSKSMNRHNIFFVVYYRKNKNEKWQWNIMKKRKRFVSFARALEKRGKEFKIYSCFSKKRLTNSEISKLLLVGKIPSKQELMLDDHD